jgi:crotonobetainyl-CoA:carnitine CoA-transferase CaiB-like acyl-CoA transferase
MRDRIANREVLLPALQARLKTRTTADWMEQFSKARLTCGVVRDTAEAAESRQFAASELSLHLVAADGRSVRTIRSPARFDSFSLAPSRPAPGLDEDRAAIERRFENRRLAPDAVE